MPRDAAAVRHIERIRLDGDIAVMIPICAVRIDMRIVEIDLTAADGEVPPMRIDIACKIDAARAAVDRLLDVHAERHIDRAALP